MIALRTRPPLDRTSGRRRSSAFERAAIRVMLAIAAGAAVFAPGEPAGWDVADGLLRAGWTVGLALATSYSRRWSWLVLAGGAGALAGGETVPTVLAALALALAIWANFTGPRSRPAGIAVGALAAHAIMRWPTDGFTGRATLAAALLLLPVAMSFWNVAPRRVRRQVLIGVAVAFGFVVLSSAALVASVWSSRSSVLRGIDLAEEGLDLARDGDQDGAARKFALAAEEFSLAHDRVNAPWALPARLVPVVGSQATAVDIATGEGARLSEVAAIAASEVDLDALTLVDGNIDLAAIERYESPLRETADALNRAVARVEEADSPWLVWNLDTRVERFQEELADAVPLANNVADSIEAAPALLGADGPRTYLIVFMTPSELRGLGGFIGAFAQLDVDDGQVTLTRTGRPDELNRVLRAGAPTLSGPADYLERYGRYRPQLFFQDVSFSPDFPSVARVVEELYPQAGGVELDGVLALDPRALAGFLSLTGPVEVGGRRLLSRDAEQYLLHEQYFEFSDDDAERQDFLDDALRETFQTLLTIEAPAPRALADALRPSIRQDRLMFHSIRDDEQALFEQVGVSGTFPEVDNHDFLAVSSQNSGNNKIDYFLEREMFYDVSYDEARGSVDATLTVTLTNNAPDRGMPLAVIGNNDRGLPLGTNQLLFSVYTPHRLTSTSIDGTETSTQIGTEQGYQVYTLFVDLGPGDSSTLVFGLEGFVLPTDEYRLTVAPQPMVNPDVLHITVEDADGELAESFRVDGELRTDRTGPALTMDLEEDLVVEVSTGGI